MLLVLRNPIYARLFGAQIVALLGTGLLTVALGLLAYDLAGAKAGAVLGTALAIKMLAYVALAPLTQALAVRLPRKPLLIGADLIRAAIALMLPFVDAVWQVYLLIFLLQAASATFTPAFQATIPDILADERDYTNALSLSRLAYDLENLISPALAGVLLLLIGYHWLFLGTVFGFIGSAMLVWRTDVPPQAAQPPRPFLTRLTRGMRIYLATPRLRGLLALNLATAAAGAFVIVNTVVLVRAGYGAGEAAVAQALAAFGAGSMVAALALPQLLGRFSDRQVMVPAAASLTVLTPGLGLWMLISLPTWGILLALWALIGFGYSATLTPSGRLLRVSAAAADRPALFAAQFALSHLCWLITYPLAGWAGATLGLPAALLLLGVVAAMGVVLAIRLWPADMPDAIAHSHPDLPPDHPHLSADESQGPHSHPYVIDDEHHHWPRAS